MHIRKKAPSPVWAKREGLFSGRYGTGKTRSGYTPSRQAQNILNDMFNYNGSVCVCTTSLYSKLHIISSQQCLAFPSFSPHCCRLHDQAVNAQYRQGCRLESQSTFLKREGFIDIQKSKSQPAYIHAYLSDLFSYALYN